MSRRRRQAARRRAERFEARMAHPSWSDRCRICGELDCDVHCSWCGSATDCIPDCPVATGVYPTQPEQVGMVCFRCPTEFAIGDAYTYIDVGPEDEVVLWAAVCLGCRCAAEVLGG